MVLISQEKINALLTALTEENIFLALFLLPFNLWAVLYKLPRLGFSVIVINTKEMVTISNPLDPVIGKPAFKSPHPWFL